MFKWLINFFTGKVDCDKIIAGYEEAIAEKQGEIKFLERMLNETRLEKEKARKTKGV